MAGDVKSVVIPMYETQLGTLAIDHFCPRHGRQSRPIEIPGLRCDCLDHLSTALRAAMPRTDVDRMKIEFVDRVIKDLVAEGRIADECEGMSYVEQLIRERT